MPPVPGAHAPSSDIERALCEALTRDDVAHEHRSLHFRVELGDGEAVRYDPDIVVRRGGLLFLVQSIGMQDLGRQVAIVTRFLQQHSEEIVLVLVGPEAVLKRLPPEAYDEAYADTEVPGVVARIREQDTRGFLDPFPKRGGDR